MICLAKDLAFAGVVQVMDGERLDDRTCLWREILSGVVGVVIREMRIIAQSSTGEIKHGYGKIEQMNVSLWKPVADKRREQTGPGAELNDRLCALRDQGDRPAIEGIATGDQE